MQKIKKIKNKSHQIDHEKDTCLQQECGVSPYSTLAGNGPIQKLKFSQLYP